MNHNNLLVWEKVEFTYSLEEVPPIIKAYKTRWLILIVYIIYATLSTFQWMQYAKIENIVMKYYSVSASAIHWTYLVFTIMWLILGVPASFIVDRKGLRLTALVGCFATAIGAVVKVFSIGPHLFYVVIIGQTIAAVSQVFILILPPKIAVTWFKPNEISTACSLGFVGMQLGCALGFLVPGTIVKDNEKIEDIGSGLYRLCSGVAAVILPVAFILLLYYPKRPNHAPSQAQLEERENKETVTLSAFLGSVKALIKNKPFIIYAIAYGICAGTFVAVETILDQSNLEETERGPISLGLVMLVVGILGSVLTGFILDKTHKYKQVAFSLFLLSAISVGLLLLAFKYKLKWMVYLIASVSGLLLNSCMLAGIEFAMEITFPTPESTTIGLLIVTSQIFGVILTILSTVINSKYGMVWTITAQVSILLIGSLLTFFTPNNLRRHEAFRKNIRFGEVPQVDRT